MDKFQDIQLELDRLEQEIDVQINQKELVMKILARYSSHYTVFRELIQNADDAQSHHLRLRLNPCQLN